MEVLTKKIMEYFDLTFLNKSDLEEHLSRSAIGFFVCDFPPPRNGVTQTHSTLFGDCIFSDNISSPKLHSV